MNDTLETNLLSWPTVILSFLSFISCLYVCISAIRAKYITCTCSWIKINQNAEYQTMENSQNSNSQNPQKKTVLMMEIVFWMCITDGLHDNYGINAQLVTTSITYNILEYHTM